jgi:hypothetical protein
LCHSANNYITTYLSGCLRACRATGIPLSQAFCACPAGVAVRTHTLANLSTRTHPHTLAHFWGSRWKVRSVMRVGTVLQSVREPCITTADCRTVCNRAPPPLPADPDRLHMDGRSCNSRHDGAGHSSNTSVWAGLGSSDVQHRLSTLLASARARGTSSEATCALNPTIHGSSLPSQ